jgi:hypothetical protein
LARVTAQLQLLTSLGTTYSEARNSGTNSRGALSLIGSGARISYDSPLWPAIQRELTLAAQYAYIVTHGYLTLPGAVPIGALVCTWRWALAVEPLDAAEYMYRSNDQSNLKAFVNSHPGNYLCTEPRLP